MGDDADFVPVRDNRAFNHKVTLNVVNNRDMEAFNRQRQAISLWSRDDVEDKYLRLYEENLLLKKHARKQEEKIKRMATKLLRLVNDKKKEQMEKNEPTAVKHGVAGRDVAMEEILEDLHGKVRDLERNNQHLKDKLLVTKQQLTVQYERYTPYQVVPSRVDSGLPKTTDPRLAKNIRVAGPRPRDHVLPRHGHTVHDDSKQQNRELKGIIAQQLEQLNIYEQDLENYHQQMRIRDAEFEEDLVKIKQQAAAGHRATVQENVDLIKMQREVREKTSKLEQLQVKYEGMEKKLNTIKLSHDHLLREMETQSEYLQQEQSRVISLQNELKDGSANHRRILELEELTDSMEKEMRIIKEANEKLVHSAFDLERERDWRQREKALKVQIAQLEATLKADVGEKGGVLDRLTTERDAREKSEKELSEMRIKFYDMKQEFDDTREKMRYFTQESQVDFTEIEEALVLVRHKKQKVDDHLDFLEKVEDESIKDYKKEFVKVQAHFAETVNELEKTRNMLIVQHNINKDYQNELDAVIRKMEENKCEYETKLDEYARLLDIRAARIKKLEHQLRDVAYGTKQYRVRPEDMEISDADDVDDSVSLERGENLFEIHIAKVSLSDEGLNQLQDEDPTTFCTWEFYEFELQRTGLISGRSPNYQFTSQYVVKVDDFFLHFLQKETSTLELHQAMGTDYRTVGACQLVFREIFEKAQGRIHGTAQLMGVSDFVGVNFGVVEYWLRLRVPVDQALRLYKERTKALGYISTNTKASEQALLALEESARTRSSDNVNQLHIKVIRCTGLESRHEGLQPSSYAVYKFFDYPDHDTPIVPSSNQPEFQDRKIFPVTMTADVDRYLKSQALMIYLFDDTETDESSYLGVATVPLITLAHDKPIKGTYDLRRVDGTQNGTIDVQLIWQFSYLPPRGATRTAAQILASGIIEEMSGPSVALMPGEDISKSIHQIRQLNKSALNTSNQPAPVPSSRQSQSNKSLAKPKPRAADESGHTAAAAESRSSPKSQSSAEASRHASPQKVSATDEMVMPSAAALAASAAGAEELIAPVQRPVPSRRAKPATGSREEGLALLTQSLVVNEVAEAAESAPLRVTSEELQQQLKGLASRTDSSTNGVGLPSDKASKPTSRPARALSDGSCYVPAAFPRKSPRSRSEPVNTWPRVPEVKQEDESDEIEEEIEKEIEEEVDEAESTNGYVGENEEESPMEGNEDYEITDKKSSRLSTNGIIKEDKTKTKAEKPQVDKDKTKVKNGKKTAKKKEESKKNGAAASASSSKSVKSGGESSMESDSEGLIIHNARSVSRSTTLKSDTVTVTIYSLTFDEGTKVMADDKVQMLFVEYRFLGCPAEELETPYPLPKPAQPDVPIIFNFTKVFHVDMENEYERRQYLASMLLPDDSDQGRIRFTVVSEPIDENSSAECEDVGVAFVSVRDILNTKSDLIEKSVPVYAIDDESTVIGALMVTVECLHALQAVQEEMVADRVLDTALANM